MKRKALWLFTLCAGVIVVSFQYPRSAWFCGWFAINLVTVGVAYIRGAHGVFGKRTDGLLPLWSWIFFLPFLLCTYAMWHAVRLLSSEPKYALVSQELCIGRRLCSHEVQGSFNNYIDLAAEFSAPRAVRRRIGYVSFPILDGGVPNPADVAMLVRSLKPGRTYVHCAQGHGRTGTIAAALLLLKREMLTADEALKVIQMARPGVRLNAEQQGFVRQLATVEPG